MVIVTVLSFIISVAAAIIIMVLRDVISYAFTEGEVVAGAVSDLCPLLALTLILNGVQPVLSGVAVGCGWQTFVAYVNVGCYYFVGVPLGYLLGFYFDLGAKVLTYISFLFLSCSAIFNCIDISLTCCWVWFQGIWSGMIGGTIMQTLILIWVTYRTDWKKEVKSFKYFSIKATTILLHVNFTASIYSPFLLGLNGRLKKLERDWMPGRIRRRSLF